MSSLVAALGILALGADPEPAISLESLLDEMVDRDRLARLPDPPYVSRQASSYDRGSVAPDAPGWFANRDTAQFIRIEERRGREEKVMMEADGPGAIVRFWMGAVDGPAVGPPGTLRIYLDGAETPAIEGVADAIVGGRALVGPPLAAIRSIGRNLYLPIPYAKRCEVTYEGGGRCWYVIQYRRYPAGTRVRPFAMGDLRAADRVGRLLLAPQNSVDPAARILAPAVR
ncbi:MAG: hypothetical protein JXP34_27255, partial [Planctomycetes bacterium]|nr:hypothetical protein [Planctomycetota bacterium]